MTDSRQSFQQHKHKKKGHMNVRKISVEEVVDECIALLFCRNKREMTVCEWRNAADIIAQMSWCNGSYYAYDQQ